MHVGAPRARNNTTSCVVNIYVYINSGHVIITLTAGFGERCICLPVCGDIYIYLLK